MELRVFQHPNMPKAIMFQGYLTISDFVTPNGSKITMNILMTF